MPACTEAVAASGGAQMNMSTPVRKTIAGQPLAWVLHLGSMFS